MVRLSGMAAPAPFYDRLDGCELGEVGDFRCLVPGCCWEVKGVKRGQIPWEQHLQSVHPTEVANHTDMKLLIISRAATCGRKRRVGVDSDAELVARIAARKRHRQDRMKVSPHGG